ncbi:hypothetical protein GF359_02110 [candidate division WOR-3 bacterium]|uniref:Galactose-1-phosphate uridylyltransferase n=1 Tax=candidate division WOR-3 bacterium TaxID=2052148 RepID=A0A9D5QCF6_UNCW3|nr:hypothetical protein [candidate division WOR-3 bacterium]MBD3363987.1 hypothetical protein [candidate division WOR-3 bacterium]
MQTERKAVLEDPLGSGPVIVTPRRAERPKDSEGQKGVCPFCPGHEDRTPPTLLSLPEGAARWKVRVFSNLFPITDETTDSPGSGVHEVVVETPKHDARFCELTLKGISLVMQAIRSRFSFHNSNENLKALTAFRNQGIRGGASLKHPHTQLVGLSEVPPRLAAESVGFIRLAEKGKCPLCLSASDPFIITEVESFRAFSPPAPRFPYETWIAPVHHEPSFANLTDVELDDLAALLKRVLTSFTSIFTPFDYNLIIHTEPLTDESGTFHTHIEILPRTEPIAGFETGTGMMVNPVPPLKAVRDLRDILII